MSDTEKLAVFPDIVPDSAIKTRRWVHENGDFKDEDSVSDLLARLYDYPEDEFYLYVPKAEQISTPLRAAIDNGSVIITESKGHYYSHPKFKRDYVCIKEGFTRWEWEREVTFPRNFVFQG